MNVLKTIYNLILTALGVWSPTLNLEYETPTADSEIDSTHQDQIGGVWHL